MTIVGAILKGIKWNETIASPVTVRVDKNGFYIYWVCQNGETDTLDISSIRDTRTGKYARVPTSAKLRTTINYCGNSDAVEDKQIQIIFGSQLHNLSELNFSCASKEYAQLWTTELLKLANDNKAINACPMTFLKKAHARLRFMVEKGDLLPIRKLTKSLTKDKVEAKKIEKALEMTNIPIRNDAILIDDFTFEKYFTFYRNLVQFQEVEQLYDRLFPDALQYHPSQHINSNHQTSQTSQAFGSSHSQKSDFSINSLGAGGRIITVDSFTRFINAHQRDPRLNEILHPYTTIEQAWELIKKYEPRKELSSRRRISFDGFLRYLMSEDNAIVSPERLAYDDMDQPLNQYFINSSHNTYLTGHQLRGKSSVDMYRQCLLAGCRCVELDCWNGKVDEEPIITHGYTVVTEISFKEVLEAINESAFKTSPYPVILSFENHCSPRQQAKMVQYCKEIFGSDTLLTEPLADFPLDQNAPLPSPNQLLRKIIIKNKKKMPKKETAAQKSFTPASSVVAACDIEEQEIEESDQEEEELPPIDGVQPVEAMAAPVSREAEPAVEMSALVVYLQPVRFKSFDESKRRNKNYEVSSFAENQATSLLKEKPLEFVLMNKRQFTRVYPRATRVDSSNYIPQMFWNAGCQMVALNFQTLDLGMQLNMGLFDYNCRCGYILKPNLMRRPDRVLDPFTETTVDGIIAGTVSVTVMSGQFMSERRANTFVEVEIYGLPIDTVRRKRTKVVQSNGLNPIYDSHRPFVFKKVVMPELAYLRIAAYEEFGRSSKLIGYRILPLTGIRPGIRHLTLRSESNQPLTLASLFLNIQVNDYVPDDLSELADALANPIAHQSIMDKRAKQLMLLDEMNESK